MIHSPLSLQRSSPFSAGLVNASILLYTVWLLLPAAQTTFGALGGVLCVGLFALGVLLDGAYCKRYWADFLLRAACAAALPLIFWFFLQRGGGQFFGYYCQQGMFWFPLFFCAYARNRGDKRLWRFWNITLLACFCITTLTTIGWLIQGMLRGGRVYAYSRSLGSGEAGQAYLEELMLRNIGGYDFVYASTLALPFTCYGVRAHGGWARAGLLCLCGAQVLMIALSQYTYALLFALAVLALELVAAFARFLALRVFHRPLRVLPSYLWALLPFGLVYLLRVPLISLGISLFQSVGFTNFAYSLSQLLNVMTGHAVDAGTRLEFYRLPIEGIAQSPWVGSLAGGPLLLSKHSDLLDLLSGVGILGAVLTFGLMGCIGRGSLRGLRSHAAMPTLLLQWVLLLGCALLGTVTYSRDISLLLCAGAFFLLENPSPEVV